MTQQDAVPPQGPASAPPPEAAPAAPQATPPEAPKKRSKLPRILVGVLVAAVVLGIGLWQAMENPGNAKVGDCVAGATAEELKIVDCGSGEAQYKVVGRVEDQPESALQSACVKYREAEQAYWQSETGKDGVVLCLKPAGHEGHGK